MPELFNGRLAGGGAADPAGRIVDEADPARSWLAPEATATRQYPDCQYPHWPCPQLAVPQLAVPQLAVPQLAIPQLAVPQLAVRRLAVGVDGGWVPPAP